MVRDKMPDAEALRLAQTADLLWPDRYGLGLTKLEMEALIFAASDSQQKSRRDGDLVRDDYNNLLRLALGKLQDAHMRMHNEGWLG